MYSVDLNFMQMQLSKVFFFYICHATFMDVKCDAILRTYIRNVILGSCKNDHDAYWGSCKNDHDVH